MPTIRIAAAVIDDGQGRTLLVRKVNTAFFMQAGGKIEAGETARAALLRELKEEIGLDIPEQSPRHLGCFVAEAANEFGHLVEAELFHIRTACQPQASAEIEETVWIELDRAAQLTLAPLTRDHVLPLARRL